MRWIAFAFALAALVAGGCGDNGEVEAPPQPVTGTYIGQEVWISYGPQKPGEPEVRVGRTPEQARRLAEDVRRRAEAGEGIGALARRHSNMLGSIADGFTGVLPHDRMAPDVRDRALAAVDVGGLTSIYEWRRGFGFAKRVSLTRGQELANLLQRVRKERVRIRAIGLLYQGAWIADPEAAATVSRTKEEAIALADDLLDRIGAGEDFAVLAAEYSIDIYGSKNGGEVRVPQQDRTWTVWIPRYTNLLPLSVLEAAYATPPGTVHPEVIVSPRGVFLVMVEERKTM